MADSLAKAGTKVNSREAQAVVELGIAIGVGQFASQLCPSCEGGPNKARTLSLDVGQNGIIKFFCHRASCDFQGSVYTNPGAARLGVRQPGATTPKGRGENPLLDPISPLSEREYAFFLSRFALPTDTVDSRIYRTDSRYALPIFRPDQRRRGFITRRPYADSPADTAANRNHPQYAVKSLTYLESDEPCQSWYGASIPEALIIVEDPLSAMRITSYWQGIEGESYPVTAVAILGTGVNAEKIGEIQKVARNCPVYIALDADATAQAFAMSRKWGSAFHSCRVCVLSKDIKDSSDEELAGLPL
jgi:hypothetical protein